MRYGGVGKLLGSYNGTVSIALQNYVLGRFVLVDCCALVVAVVVIVICYCIAKTKLGFRP